MGLDLSMTSGVCKSCNRSESGKDFYITYNLSPMWKAMFPEKKFMCIDGMTGKESLIQLKLALMLLESNEKTLKPLEPENGWGSYEGFKSVLKELIEEAKNHPDWYWILGR